MVTVRLTIPLRREYGAGLCTGTVLGDLPLGDHAESESMQHERCAHQRTMHPRYTLRIPKVVCPRRWSKPGDLEAATLGFQRVSPHSGGPTRNILRQLPRNTNAAGRGQPTVSRWKSGRRYPSCSGDRACRRGVSTAQHAAHARHSADPFPAGGRPQRPSRPRIPETLHATCDALEASP